MFPPYMALIFHFEMHFSICSNLDQSKILLSGNGLPIPTQWHLLSPLGNKPFEIAVGKGETARNEQFLRFPQCFLPFWRTFCHIYQIWNCRLQPLWIWKGLKHVVWETEQCLNVFKNKVNFRSISSSGSPTTVCPRNECICLWHVGIQILKINKEWHVEGYNLLTFT